MTEHTGADRTVDTVVMPFTTAQIGGSHVSGSTLGAGLQRVFGVRSIVVAPEGAEVLDLARKLGMDTQVSGDPARWRHRPDRDLLRTPARMAMLRALPGRRLVHCNDLGALQAWAPAARLLGIPLVYHCRAFDRNRWFNRAIIRTADHVISIAQGVDASLDYLPRARRSVLVNPFSTPLSVDSATARGRLLADLGVEDARIVGFVGNMWKRKRPEMFVDIARRLATDDPSLRFVLFGRDGDVTTDMMRARIAAAGLTDRFLMAGFRLPPEANLAALDLLLMPALDEPFGRTPVEALLLGIPYVAADDAGHSEIHQRWGGGRVLPVAADADAYADICRRVLADPDSVRLSMEQRRAIHAELSPDRHAVDVMDVYGRLRR
jgi:glycosyltransferase involved in cell wall biosynthesis